ncbi:hypothetical protein NFJ02_11g07470 [Pycnococcus provasolii]
MPLPPRRLWLLCGLCEIAAGAAPLLVSGGSCSSRPPSPPRATRRNENKQKQLGQCTQQTTTKTPAR